MTSTTDEPYNEIFMSKLKGHQGSVLCLDLSLPTADDSVDQFTKSPSTSTSSLSSTTSLLLSGSEDHTARLWDVREHRRRTCLCVQTSGDVLSAVFAPNRFTDPQTIINLKRPLSSPFALDYTIYLAVENTVLEYDLRHSQAPIVRYDPDALKPVLQHQDEVNQISLAYGCVPSQQHQPKGRKRHKKGGTNRKTQNNNSSDDTLTNTINKNSLYLAACDDAGMVRFVDVLNTTATTTTSTILHHDSEGVAVVPTCAIRPRSVPKNGKATMASGLELVTGGSDCKIHLWDLSKPKCVENKK